MKLCKDCKYFKEFNNISHDLSSSVCHHPKNINFIETDFVSGDEKVYWRFRYANTLRSAGTFYSWMYKYCGQKADWFEPKDK